MAARGVPDYFGWARYGIGPADVVRMTLGCEPGRIRPLVVFAPSWMPSLVFAQAERSDSVSDGWMPVDDITCGGVSFSYVRRALGHPWPGTRRWRSGARPARTFCWLTRRLGRT